MERWTRVEKKGRAAVAACDPRGEDRERDCMCINWNRSGKCPLFNARKCKWSHPNICKSHKMSGACSHTDCPFFHPQICTVWKQKGYCLCLNDKYMYHPVVCRKGTDCTDDRCQLFHPETNAERPHDIRTMQKFSRKDIKLIVADPAYESVDEGMRAYLDVQTSMFDVFFDEVIKSRRKTLFDSVVRDCRPLVDELSRMGDYSPFNTLVWGYASNEYDTLVYMCGVLVNKFKFKLLTGNRKYVYENVFVTLQHPENTMPAHTKKMLFEHCMFKVGDDQYWFSVCRNQMNKVADFRKSKNAIVFSVSKCHLRILEFYVKQFMSKPVKINGDAADTENIYKGIFGIIFAIDSVESGSEFDVYFGRIDLSALKEELCSTAAERILGWRDEISGRGSPSSDTDSAMFSVLGWMYRNHRRSSTMDRIRPILFNHIVLCRHFVTWLRCAGIADTKPRLYEREAIDAFFSERYVSSDMDNIDKVLVDNWLAEKKYVLPH
jgi:hypothetical protein